MTAHICLRSAAGIYKLKYRVVWTEFNLNLQYNPIIESQDHYKAEYKKKINL